jgi:hypothetical protein
VEPAGKALVGEAMSRLGQQAFRIGVVGQIKSGKSSFINAFVRQPSLLPTDVTPWTTTVTNLHFGQAGAGKHAAQFQFFSESEWQDLAHGGGRVRELTQRLVPGFEPEILRQHVEALKRRASARLGPEFEALLGCGHHFEAVSSDLLLRYVCSGDFAAGTQIAQLGKYADITKRADLYLDGGPFDFRVTVTDTPGTNDPFLIRDEITRRSLESADLYVVVLTARQPLSESDVALMRLMHGLNRDRIIVFVNRIDDFTDVGYDLAEVLVYIEKKLKLLFPGARIPIVAGSAAWASCAIEDDTGSLDRLFERPSLGYLVDAGLVHPEDLEWRAINDPAARDRLRRALYTASGLPAMYRTIAEHMGSCQAAQVQLQTARRFSEMVHASANASRYELQTSASGAAGTPAQRHPTDPVSLANEARTLDQVAKNVEQSAKTIEQQLGIMIAEEMGALRHALQSAVAAHGAQERQILIETLARGRAPRVWTHEGVELRRTLGKVFIDGFIRAAARVLDFQGRVGPELRGLMKLIAPDMPMPADPESALLEIPSPSVSALGRFVALDLDSSWWGSFWRGRASPAAYGDQIEALVRSEFEPVVEELVETAQRALSGYAATTTQWSFGLSLNIVQGLQRRREYLLARSGAAGGGEDPAAAQKEQARLLDDRLQQCNALDRQLDGIVRSLGSGLQQTWGLAS